jgi:hypothetical protein
VEPVYCPSDSGWAAANFATPDVSGKILFGAYNPALSLFGLVVPIVPIPGFIVRNTLLRVGLTLSGGADAAVMRPDSIRVLIGEKEFPPTSIEIWDCGLGDEPEQRKGCSPDKPIGRGFVTYEFHLHSPSEFSLVAQGLPRMEFHPTRRWFFENPIRGYSEGLCSDIGAGKKEAAEGLSSAAIL